MAKTKLAAQALGAAEEAPETDGKDRKLQRRMRGVARACGIVAVFAVMAVVMTQVTAYADTDLSDVITQGANNVYSLVRTIATPVAAVSFAIALVLTFFSHNQKTIDTSRQVAKGIVVTWIILMLIGPIFNFVSDKILGNDGTSYISDELPKIDTGTAGD